MSEESDSLFATYWKVLRIPYKSKNRDPRDVHFDEYEIVA